MCVPDKENYEFFCVFHSSGERYFCFACIDLPPNYPTSRPKDMTGVGLAVCYINCILSKGSTLSLETKCIPALLSGIWVNSARIGQ
jgi:hypothetical protein